MSNIRKLRSPKGSIRVALTSGHTIIITEEAREVGELFWAEAYALGAISGDMESKTAVEKIELENAEAFLKSEEASAELLKLLSDLFENPRGALDANNNPIVRKISAMLGRSVKKAEVIAIWKTLEKDKG